MTRILTGLVVGLALAASATAQDLSPREQAVAEIMQTDRDFAAMAAAETISDAFGHYMHSVEGMLVRGSNEPIRGEAAIREEFADYPPELVLHWDPSEGYASEAGDFGVTWGWYFVHPDGDLATPPSGRGKYVTIWRRDSDGNWRGLLDMGTSDGSYQPPEPEGDSRDGSEDD
jgi:ketosteroid isomerase-like protein